jgi:hypothetical protein
VEEGGLQVEAAEQPMNQAVLAGRHGGLALGCAMHDAANLMKCGVPSQRRSFDNDICVGGCSVRPDGARAGFQFWPKFPVDRGKRDSASFFTCIGA